MCNITCLSKHCFIQLVLLSCRGSIDRRLSQTHVTYRSCAYPELCPYLPPKCPKYAQSIKEWFRVCPTRVRYVNYALEHVDPWCVHNMSLIISNTHLKVRRQLHSSHFCFAWVCVGGPRFVSNAPAHVAKTSKAGKHMILVFNALWLFVKCTYCRQITSPHNPYCMHLSSISSGRGPWHGLNMYVTCCHGGQGSNREAPLRC